ncbi:hypothetical protein [Nocardia sp. NPDC057272]|uniref:hypothetical protein n=1 Tax=Nocardia sp. NPDC057272 TaxID=3346079 RepID=UPI0036351528
MPSQSLALFTLIALSDAGAHAAPMLPFMPAQAYEMMQILGACRAKQRPRKSIALDVLGGAGRMVRAENRPR